MEDTFEYEDETVKAVIVLRSATGRIGVQRSNMISDAYAEIEKENKAHPAHPIQPMEVINRAHRVPLLTAAADIKLFQVDGKDAKLDAALCETLPDLFLWEWEQHVYKVNPHWRFNASLESVEALQKKAMKPTTGSKSSTKPDEKEKQ